MRARIFFGDWTATMGIISFFDRRKDWIFVRWQSKGLPFFLIGISLLCSMSVRLSFAQQLTKQKLVELHRSGVSDDLLVQQIRHDGISFALNADTTLELKRGGLSDVVLSALFEITGEPTKLLDHRAPITIAREFYDRGEYPKLVDFAHDALQKSPRDFQMAMVLILGELRLNDLESARAQFEDIQRQPLSAVDKNIFSNVDLLLQRVDAQNAVKGRLVEALRELDATKAKSEIDNLAVDDQEKLLLGTYLDVFRADFDIADHKAALLQVPFDQKKQLQDYIRKARAEYQRIGIHVDDYLYSSLNPSLCDNSNGAMATTFGEFSRWSLADYRGSVREMAQISPLADRSLDLVFHAQLLATKYEDLEVIGDKILSAKGSIRIPGASADHFYTFVIDGRNRKLRTEPDNHTFLVRYASHGGIFGSLDENVKVNKVNAELVPVNLSFSEVTRIEQRVGGRNSLDSETMRSKPEVLRFKPSGVVPDYAMMQYLACIYGMKAQLTTSRNLALYIIHVIDRNDVRAELADPGKAHGNAGTDALLVGLTGLNASLATEHGTVVDQAMAQQMLQVAHTVQASDAENEKNQQHMQLAWYDVLNHQSLVFFAEDSFKMVERALNLGR